MGGPGPGSGNIVGWRHSIFDASPMPTLPSPLQCQCSGGECPRPSVRPEPRRLRRPTRRLHGSKETVAVSPCPPTSRAASCMHLADTHSPHHVTLLDQRRPCAWYRYNLSTFRSPFKVHNTNTYTVEDWLPFCRLHQNIK